MLAKNEVRVCRLEKLRGIWPLPGGIRSYVVTLRKILAKVDGENLTTDEFASWLRNEYGLSGARSPYGYLRVVESCLGFLHKEDGFLKLTSKAEEFLKTGNRKLVFDALRSHILGFDEIISMLAESERLDLLEVHKALIEKCKVNWQKTNQAMWRMNWLMSLGYVDKRHRKYFLTQEGLKAVAGKERARVQQPLTITTPMEEYINHATVLIKKHPKMSESNTISTLIDPLLEVLGWDIRDLDEVHREYPVRVGRKTEYVDIALKIQNKPVVFVEAKSVGTDLHAHLSEQPIKYANMEGVNWCILTNGKELRLYNAFWKIRGVENKMFFRLSINEFRDHIEKLQLLSRESLESGRLDEEAEVEHAKRVILEWLKEKENSIAKEIIKQHPSLKEEYVKHTLNKLSFE